MSKFVVFFNRIHKISQNRQARRTHALQNNDILIKTQYLLKFPVSIVHSRETY